MDEAKIDNSQWETDCNIAFETALPPTWEVCDRFQKPLTLPEEVGAELNAMARRGQRLGNVKLGSIEHTVVLEPQEMYIVASRPEERSRAGRQMLRRRGQQCRLNKLALKKFYCKYAEELEPTDHPQGSDGIAAQRFLDLFQDIGVDPGTDIAALALSAACKAQEMGVFRRREFLCGCFALEVNTVEELRLKMPELRASLKTNVKIMKDVYEYTFTVALEAPCKVLPVVEAAEYWKLLLGDWPLKEAFCSWAVGSMKGKAVKKDMWMQVLKFATEVPPDLSTYDDDPSWPVALDEFVEFYREQK